MCVYVRCGMVIVRLPRQIISGQQRSRRTYHISNTAHSSSHHTAAAAPVAAGAVQRPQQPERVPLSLINKIIIIIFKAYR